LELSARVADNITRHNLFSPESTIIVALSGGADSTALLHILAGLTELRPRLVVAHLNHCLRGEESDCDEEFSRALATRLHLPFESVRVDVDEIARVNGLNLEDAGRRARISFLDDMRLKWNAAAVAVAHHADDQAETVLMRLLRGSGATGLAGMRFLNRRGYIRPLLNCTRQEIEAYLQQRGVEWREDASNHDTTWLRNRIRHELLPELKRYNPAVTSSLSITAQLLADENDLLDDMATEVAESICTFTNDSVSCSIKTLLRHPVALRRRIYRLMFKHVSGQLQHFSHLHTEAIEAVITAERPNASLNLPGGISLSRAYDRLGMQKAVPAVVFIREFVISGPGSYQFENGSSLLIESSGEYSGISPDAGGMVQFDPDKAPFPWLVRSFQPGDRISPVGMTGSKKVKDLFIDKKIPLNLRRQIPLVFSDNTLIWVCGVRLSANVIADEASKRTLSVRYIS